MDLPSYLLGKKSGGGGGTSNYNDLTNKPQINNVTLSGNKTLNDLGIMPIQIITNNSSSNPFVFEEHEPGIYFFENTSSTSYSVYFKRLTTNTGTFNFTMSMGMYLYYLRKTDSTTTGAVYFACIYDIAINRNNSGSVTSAILNFRQNDTKNYGFQESNTTIENYNVVGLSNNQTISGTKTFSKIPKQSNTTAPTNDAEFTNKKYVDDSIASAITTTLNGNY